MVNIRQEHNFEIDGKKVCRISGTALSTDILPSTFHSLPIAQGSIIFLLDIEKCMYRGNSDWVEMGNSEQ